MSTREEVPTTGPNLLVSAQVDGAWRAAHRLVWEACGMDVADIRYATTSGGLRLAYQVWGEGPPLMIAPALISNVEVHGEHEFYQRSRSHVGKYMTCVEFDKRGIGLSDRFEGDLPTLAERIEDIEVIMDDLERRCCGDRPSTR
jgi:hypothetical protein